MPTQYTVALPILRSRIHYQNHLAANLICIPSLYCPTSAPRTTMRSSALLAILLYTGLGASVPVLGPLDQDNDKTSGFNSTSAPALHKRNLNYYDIAITAACVRTFASYTRRLTVAVATQR